VVLAILREAALRGPSALADLLVSNTHDITYGFSHWESLMTPIIRLSRSRIAVLFTTRRYAKRDICRRRMSVCLSVCLCVCVCVSHSGIVSKRLNVGSRIIMPHDRSGTLVHTDKRVEQTLCHSRASCFF